MGNKALICITTCNRLPFVKLILPDYLKFCNKNQDYDFLLAHDGIGDAYQEYCNLYNIPLLFSKNQYGVGISKNRVLAKFDAYKYYFFIDDDVQLLNPEIFDAHIIASKETGIHHFSGGHNLYFIENRINEKYNTHKILHCNYGSGAFNFFTKEGLDIVGGWHSEFAKYKRFGHTEHSYRFVNSNINKYPFNVLADYTEGFIKINDLNHVTNFRNEDVGDSGLAKVEEEIINLKLKNFPINTFDDYYFNSKQIQINELDDTILKLSNIDFTERIFNLLSLTDKEFRVVIKELYRILLEENHICQIEKKKLEKTILNITSSRTFKWLNSIKKRL